MEFCGGLDNGATSPDHPPMVEKSRVNDGGLMMSLGKLSFERKTFARIHRRKAQFEETVLFPSKRRRNLWLRGSLSGDSVTLCCKSVEHIGLVRTVVKGAGLKVGRREFLNLNSGGCGPHLWCRDGVVELQASLGIMKTNSVQLMLVAHQQNTCRGNKYCGNGGRVQQSRCSALRMHNIVKVGPQVGPRNRPCRAGDGFLAEPLFGTSSLVV